MTQKVTELLASALELSPDEREELADCLWASVEMPDEHAGMSEEEFVAELERRARELKADQRLGVPWEEVKNRR